MKHGALLRKAIWKKRTLWELIIASIGFALGLGLFLVSAHVYFDIDAITSRRLASGTSADYLLISKKPGGTNEGFTEDEIVSLKSQSFALDLGEVLSNDFELEAEVVFFDRGFRTILFFEAVPDRFLDVVPRGWISRGDDEPLPILLSRDFLLLYNFGFAQSRSLPLLTEELLELVPVTLNVRGNGKSKRIPARIAGVSDRLASVLIPFEDMKALNGELGRLKGKAPHRLVLSVSDRTDPEIVRFLSDHAYDTSKEKLRLSDAGLAVRTILTLAGVIGVVLILLSFTVFLTAFRLGIARSWTEISILLDLGYAKATIAANSMYALLAAFVCIAIGSGVFTWVCIGVERGFLRANGLLGLELAVHPAIIISGILLILVCVLLNYISLTLFIGKAGRRK